MSVPGGRKMLDALRAELAGTRAETAKWQRQCGYWKAGSGIRRYKEALESCAAGRTDLSRRLHEAMQANEALRVERERLALRVAELEGDVRLRAAVASFIAEPAVLS